jgi:hypothetical protein
MQNINKLIENCECAKKNKKLDEDIWWEDEFGSDLTDMIDCHAIFEGDPPCLLEVRNISTYMPDTGTAKERIDNQIKRQAACAECKAKWLMQEYE